MNYVSSSPWGFNTGVESSIKAVASCLSIGVGTVSTSFGAGVIYHYSDNDSVSDSDNYVIVGTILIAAGSIGIIAPPLYYAFKCYVNGCWRKKIPANYPKETSAFNQYVRSI